MNANELAEAMQGVISVLNVHHEEDCLFIANEAQFMLRKLQAKVEALKANTLTDEEIYEIWWQTDVASDYYRDSKEFGIEFARAILRKAQEK